MRVSGCFVLANFAVITTRPYIRKVPHLTPRGLAADLTPDRHPICFSLAWPGTTKATVWCLAVPPPLCPPCLGPCYTQQQHLLLAYKQRWRLWQILIAAARQDSPKARRVAAARQASLKAHRKADARSSSIVHLRHVHRRQCAQPRSGMWRLAGCRRQRAAPTTPCRVVAPSRRQSLARLLANGWTSPHGWALPWQT